MIPQMAERLLEMPLLHTIHTIYGVDSQDYDDVPPGVSPDAVYVVNPHDYGLEVFSELDSAKRKGTLTGEVRSYIHQDHEILHVRLLMDHIEIQDKPFSAVSVEGHPADNLYIPYTFGDARRVKVFKKLDRPIWQDFTDFGGIPIPLWVLEEMKAAEGAREEWYRRGVQVGDMGWDVVNRWWARSTVGQAIMEEMKKPKKKKKQK